MCTCISLNSNDFYFGRNFDVEKSYNQSVAISPRNFDFKFTNKKEKLNNFAIIGMATVINDYPLYAEASNEKGLCIAGLNFPNNAHYYAEKSDKINISPYEFIPYLLQNYSSVSDVKKVLKKANISNIQFNDNMPLSPLHWMISDSKESIVVESTKNGLNIYDNPYHVLTNNPEFPFHLINLNNYLNLSPKEPNNHFSSKFKLEKYGTGMGAIGLPGDFSPVSRFVKAAFVRANSTIYNNESDNVLQFFHILNSVAMVNGSVQVSDNDFDITLYSSCINATKGIYYYKTYYNHEVYEINMFKEDLDSNQLINYSWISNSDFISLN